MTSNFDKTYNRLIQEAGVYGSVGGTASGPNVVSSPQQTQTSNNTSTTQQRPKINNRKIDVIKNKGFEKYDFGKEDIKPDQNKINSMEYVHNLTNNILAGRNIHPTHLSNLAGILETNPELSKELKTKGLTSDIIKNSFLKQTPLGSNVNPDNNLMDRFKKTLI